MAPAWKGTRVDPQAAMKGSGRGVVDSQTRLGFGKVLVALQVALSMVLVTGAGLMLNTFSKLTSLDAGFEREHVLLVNVDLQECKLSGKERRVAGFREEMLEHLRAAPGVRSLLRDPHIVPVSGQGWNTTVEADGFVAKSRRDAVSLAIESVSVREYFEDHEYAVPCRARFQRSRYHPVRCGRSR